jgi:hypothetical protein
MLVHGVADDGIELLGITFHHFFSETAEKEQGCNRNQEGAEQENAERDFIRGGFAFRHLRDST